MDKLKQDEICGWCNKTDELVLMQQGGHVHTICRECGSNGPLVTTNELGKVHKSQLRQIAALEKRCAELESVIRKPESNCSCSWDYVTGASPKYYCGKCGRPMST